MDRYTVVSVDPCDMERTPEGMWVMHDDATAAIAAAVAAERNRWLRILSDRLAGAVMSKYASVSECEAARDALMIALADGLRA